MHYKKTLTLKKPTLGKSKEELEAEKRQAQLVKEMEDKKAALELKKQKKRELFETLLKDYPDCFSRQNPKPLKQGIAKDIAPFLSK